MRPIKLARTGLKALTKAGAAVAMALLVALVFTYSFDVFTRYVLNAPQQWPSNAVAAFFCVAIFLALPEVARRGEHITIDLVPEKIPLSVRGAFLRLLLGLAVIVCLVVAYICATEVAKQVARGTTTQGSLPFPKWWISASIPYGFALTALNFLSVAILPADKTKFGTRD